MKAIVLGILLLILLTSSCAKEISGGIDVTSDQGKDIQDGAPQEYTINKDVNKPDARDPIQLHAPNSHTIPPIPPEPVTNESGQARINSEMVFSMIGSVSGSGRYSEYRSLGDMGKLGLRQTPSASYGKFDLQNALVYVNSYPNNYATTPTPNEDVILFSRDLINFTGNDYTTWETYSNGGDTVHNSYWAGRIVKDSSYMGTFTYLNSSNYEDIIEPNYLYYNKSSKYRLESGFIGLSSFYSSNRGNATSEISQDYAGKFVLTLNLDSQNFFNGTWYQESFLPCCNLTPTITPTSIFNEG